ncbi:unnamed protein product [Sphagnum troendelagicum]|uniref:PPM-type phosphatase domain-containing protein n=1 Tax=Sphagnum troendelagicum TaxID=128251 RepID=A0ABP0UPD6_9BRYO
MQAGQQRPLAHEGAIHVASGPVQAEMAVDRGITIGKVALQGPRKEMEDELVTESHGPSGFMYAAIFDGHTGFSSAQFLRDELYKERVTAFEGGALLESQDLSDAETVVTCAFFLYMSYWASCFLSQCASSVETVAVRNGNYRLEETQTVAEKESGSTATIMFVHSDRLLLAHVRDSRVVLSKGGKAVDLCSDHQPHGSSKPSIAEVS